ncbi:MAG: hypothetical protein KJZ69_18900 [Phycisphaerales bacterium]|nr:hypothetical protein [Phycisphaerales bacterium]MCL4198994.1 hypothetical protein [Phycisphaerales bacterium]MCL4199569.1 hypothetical protein [Phycisphaerales bacterium]
MAESDIEQAIKQSAQGPAKASGDSGSVEQHGLAEQIEADRYLESKKASRGKGLKVKFVQLEPPGTA